MNKSLSQNTLRLKPLNINQELKARNSNRSEKRLDLNPPNIRKKIINYNTSLKSMTIANDSQPKNSDQFSKSMKRNLANTYTQFSKIVTNDKELLKSPKMKISKFTTRNDFTKTLDFETSASLIQEKSGLTGSIVLPNHQNYMQSKSVFGGLSYKTSSHNFLNSTTFKQNLSSLEKTNNGSFESFMLRYNKKKTEIRESPSQISVHKKEIAKHHDSIIDQIDDEHKNITEATETDECVAFWDNLIRIANKHAEIDEDIIIGGNLQR